MDTIKRNYTTVNNWLKAMKSLCGFNISLKIVVYNTLSFEIDKNCFEVTTSLENILTHFGEYFVYHVTTDKYGDTYIPCLKLLVCRNHPDEKYWVEHMVECEGD